MKLTVDEIIRASLLACRWIEKIQDKRKLRCGRHIADRCCRVANEVCAMLGFRSHRAPVCAALRSETTAQSSRTPDEQRQRRQHRVKTMRTFGGSNALAITCALLGAASLSTARASVVYTYDDLGRVASVTYDDGKRVTYTYDPAGNRTQHVVDQAANQPPAAANDFASVDIASSNSVLIFPLVNDSDPDSDILTVQSLTTPVRGTAAITGGGASVLYTYTASPLFVPTTDSFSYTVSDGRGGTATATVQIEVVDLGGPCVPPPGQFECVIE